MILLSFPAPPPTIYYVSLSGNDQNDGTSVATAWKTLKKVKATHFQPGDQVLFEGGSTFKGSIWLRSQSWGTASEPIVIGSYGQKRARISSGTSYGFYAHNLGGIEVRDLEFVGSGRLTNTGSGVVFHVDQPNLHLQHIILDNVRAHGYLVAGINIGSSNGTSGYQHVRITNCVASGNGEAGIKSFAQELAAHHQWYISNCQAFDNAGRPDITDTHTGNGIVLAGIDGALIEHCEAYYNGWLNANPGGGPVGIWGWNCNQLVIQHCESHHNRSGTMKDGGGFDLDGGCTNSILQYNYSHDNEGPGYLLAQYQNAPPLHDVTIRYNISENDGRRHGHGAIQLWSSGANGGIQRANIYNNTVFLSPPADGSQPKAVEITSDGVHDIVLHNNLLQTSGGLPLVHNVASRGVLLQGNAYWSDGHPLLFQWDKQEYTSLEAWRNSTSQETLDFQPTGLVLEPGLINPGAGGTVSPLHSGRPLATLTAYHVKPDSKLRSTGLDLATQFGIDAGTQDFFGSPVPARGTKGTIGAYEAIGGC
ncbi:right-handed parallel beta-helix repeat-containing protein [Hymenobacter tibetensis]|uniref:Right-handed parallel beta-helix repeat-containing protein n=1 Tax=Hymenobacter tibetensis TaxID=497967 RepID=A0ABY4D3J8_9BACT|nr:right-handed parallel beta-helix repeat-containing protein [Hymenobacter tibetensis]UOG77000.1 right-handed parallel beta-helix repeat-containing protein [Hymenobacter tibetensis]